MDNDPFDNFNPAGFENPINLRQYWQIVLERRWLVITTFISVLILSVIYLFRATPIFEASARIKIDKDTEQVLRVGGFSIETPEQDYLQTQYKILMSRSLIEKVVHDLTLTNDERYAKAIDTAKAVASDIMISPIRLSRLVDVKVEHPSAQQAANIANCLATNFMEWNLEQKKQGTLAIANMLGEDIKERKEDLAAKQRRLDDYLRTNHIVSFVENENVALQSLKQAQQDYDTAANLAVETTTTIKKIDEFLKNDGALDSVPQVANNPEISNLKKELAVARANFDELKQRYKEKYPAYKEAKTKVDSLQSSIEAQANRLIDALRMTANSAVAVREQKSLVLQNKKEEKQKLDSAKVDYLALERDAKSTETLFNNLLASMKEKEIAGKSAVQNIHLVDRALPALHPVKPRKVLTIFLGIFGGLAAAVGLAFFVNYIDDSVKGQDDVESYLRLSFLGYVPNIKTNSVAERDLQAHLHPQSNAAEAFRTIRATVSLTHQPDKFRILSVTSTVPAEGKSLLASNLAIVTAQTGIKTLLVDADLRRPSVHKAFQLHSPRGLSNYLMEEVEKMDDLIHKTEVPNLEAICCGAVPSNPSELVCSKRMGDLLKVLRERYDRVILDCPPISAVSDPLLISSMADGVVYVTKFNKIRREHARKSVQRIQNAGIHIVGMVLNDIDFEGKDSYYYSYYYYQNRYYADYRRESPGSSREKTPVVPKGRNGS